MADLNGMSEYMTSYVVTTLESGLELVSSAPHASLNAVSLARIVEAEHALLAQRLFNVLVTALAEADPDVGLKAESAFIKGVRQLDMAVSVFIWLRKVEQPELALSGIRGFPLEEDTDEVSARAIDVGLPPEDAASTLVVVAAGVLVPAADEADLVPVLVPEADADADAEPEDETSTEAGTTEAEDEAEPVAEPAEVAAEAEAEPVAEETAAVVESVACAKAAWAKMSAEMMLVVFIFTMIIPRV